MESKKVFFRGSSFFYLKIQVWSKGDSFTTNVLKITCVNNKRQILEGKHRLKKEKNMI